MNTRNIAIILGVLLIVSALISIQSSRVQRAADTDAAENSTLGLATTTAFAESGEAASDVPAAGEPKLLAVERMEFPAQKGTLVPLPDFKAKLACSAGGDVCASLAPKYAAIQEALAKDSADFWGWVDLGTYRKIAGDHHGAAAAWEYLSKQYPTNPTSFSNLGDLYLNYLKDAAKAEQNYLAAIKNYPENVNAYRALFEMYSAQKASAKAIAILEKGIAANSKMIDLRVLLARYYKELGRPSDATAAYYGAIQAAESQGQKDLAASLRAESGL